MVLAVVFAESQFTPLTNVSGDSVNPGVYAQTHPLLVSHIRTGSLNGGSGQCQYPRQNIQGRL